MNVPRRLLRFILLPLLAIPVLSAVGATGAPSGTASASCAASPLAQPWHNIDSATRAITRVEITQSCDDVRRCDAATGICTGGTGSRLDIRTYGKCHPTDCAWGSRTLTAATDSWYLTSYAFGFKTSTVWVKTYSFYGLTYLRVWVYNDFTPADGRADYTTDEWFLA